MAYITRITISTSLSHDTYDSWFYGW